MWLGAGAYFVAALAWLGWARPPARERYDEGSALNTSPQGLSLAYRYLGERARSGAGPVAVLSRLVGPDDLPPGAVVFRVRPRVLPFLRRSVRIGEDGDEEDAPKKAGDAKKAKPPSPHDATALLTPREEEWVRRGGRLVLALAKPYGAAGVEAAPKGEVHKVYPLWPGVRQLLPEPARVLTGFVIERAHAVLVLGSRPVASRWPLGRGELFLLACPEVLENRLLGQADHLLLLEALAGTTRPVYFDEYVHGLQDQAGLIELLTRWRLGPALVLLGLVGAAAFWRGRVRVGPEEDDYQETRSDAVDLLDSLAQLYARSMRRDEALALYQESLSRAVSWKTGLRGEPLAARVRDMAGGAAPPRRRGPQDLSVAQFARALRSINEGFRRLRHAEPG